MNHPRIAAATFMLGLGLVFLVDHSIARIIGIPLMFVGIALGVAAIATPEFLDSDREPGSPEGDSVSR